MSFAPKPFEAIYAELVNSTQTRLKEVGTGGEGVDLAVGSVIRTLYESFAYEMALLYEQMDQVYHSAFIDTASGLQLEMVAAILGVKRGLPDYAEGVVTFTRDAGQEDIEIPIGTLVTTEDSDLSPRKPYTTLEAKLFPASKTEITVKVQAMERGEAQVVAANTITVMPLPVAGVKAVRNDEATQFLGKHLETDDELRLRAKSALLASGKASLTAIETALLSLPGVREVKVVEPGAVGTRENYGVLDIYIDDRDLETMPSSGWLPQSSLPTPSSSTSPNRDEDPGFLTITPAERKRVTTLRQKIDQVRAAGVYVRLHGAELVMLDGMVKIEVEATADPDAVTAAVRTAIATHLARLPLGKPLLFPPLVQAMLTVPGVANMEEFALVPHWPHQPEPSAPVLSRAKRLDPNASDRGLLASKFRLRNFQVVSQPQDIPVRVELWAESPITSEIEQSVLSALNTWFQNTLKPGTTLEKSDLLAQIPNLFSPRADSLHLTPQVSSPLVRPEDAALIPGFAERFVLGEPLALYDRNLDLVGAMRVTLPKPLTPEERNRKWTEMRTHLQQFLDRWPPRQDLSLTQLQAVATEFLPVADLVPQDFRAVEAADRLDATNLALRVEPYERLGIGHLLISDRTEPLAVTLTALELTTRWLPDEIPPSLERVEITPNADTPNEPPSLSFATSARAPENQQRAALEASLRAVLLSAISTFPAQSPGQDLDLADLYQHLANVPDRSGPFRRLDFIITSLEVEAKSVDGRSQTARLSIPAMGTPKTVIPQAAPSPASTPEAAPPPTDIPPIIHVRSLEQVAAITIPPDPASSSDSGSDPDPITPPTD